VNRLLDNWQIGQAMREAGRSHRVVVTTHGLRVEPWQSCYGELGGVLIRSSRHSVQQAER
jgi:hypothetical protein